MRRVKSSSLVDDTVVHTAMCAECHSNVYAEFRKDEKGNTFLRIVCRSCEDSQDIALPEHFEPPFPEDKRKVTPPHGDPWREAIHQAPRISARGGI